MSAEEIKVHNYARNKKILVFVNVLIVISVSILATRGFFFGAGGGQVGPNIVRTGYFKPYTIDSNICRKDCILAMTPTIIYSIVYFIMVVILKRWNDFYGFTFGGRYAILPIVVAVI